MTTREQSPKRVVAFAVVFLAVTGIGAGVYFGVDSEEDDGERGPEVAGFEPADSPGDPPDREASVDEETRSRTSPDGGDTRSASAGESTGGVESTTAPDEARPTRPRHPGEAGVENGGPDAGNRDRRSARQRARDWMPTADDVDVESIEHRLDNAEMRQQFELTRRRDRRRSVELAEEVMAGCEDRIETLSPTGDVVPRIAVEWQMRTEAGEGTIEDPRVLHRLGVDSPPFEECITGGIDGLTFEARGDGAEMAVRSVYEVGR